MRPQGVCASVPLGVCGAALGAVAVGVSSASVRHVRGEGHRSLQRLQGLHQRVLRAAHPATAEAASQSVRTCKSTLQAECTPNFADEWTALLCVQSGCS